MNTFSTKADAEAFKNLWGFYPMAGGDGAGDPPAPTPNDPPAPTPNDPPAPAPVDFAKVVPVEFKDAPWVKETKDIPALFKRTNDLITELGKRPAGIPQKNAKPEEVAAFRKAFGVPEKPEEYVFADPPAELGPANPQFQTAVKSMFHKHGISAEQASGLQKDWDALQLQMKSEMGSAQDEGFVKLKTEVFGNRADEAIKGSGALIAKYTPPQMKDKIAGLSNDALIILAGVLDGVRKEFIAEDKMPTGGGPVNAMTPDQKREEARKLMGSEAYMNKFHADHDKVKKQVDDIYASLPSK